MPQGSTVVDFAYEIHTDLGHKCIGAKINLKLVPLSHVLQNGDQVEILTSQNQTPKLEWLKFSASPKARTKIKNAFKDEKSKHTEKGKEILEEAFVKIKAPLTSNNLKKLTAHYNLNNKEQLYSEIGMGFIELDKLKDIIGKKSENKLVKYWNVTFGSGSKKQSEDEEADTSKKIDKKKPFLLKENQDTGFSLAKCCNPIPGEQVVGYLSTDDHVIIHKVECRELERFIANQGEKIIRAEWTKFKRQSYLTRLNLEGFDRMGIVNEVTTVISKGHNINMRSLKFETHDGIFKGDLFLYIHNAEDLTKLITRLKTIKGIDTVARVEDLSEES
jgi:GTP pyrophosphokinase